MSCNNCLERSIKILLNNGVTTPAKETSVVKAVEFQLITDTLEDLENKILALASLCAENNMVIQTASMIPGRAIKKCYFGEEGSEDEVVDFRCTLQIIKNKDVAYNQIYDLVNRVKACRYKKIQIAPIRI
jgi:hypothetical protein